MLGAISCFIVPRYIESLLYFSGSNIDNIVVNSWRRQECVLMSERFFYEYLTVLCVILCMVIYISANKCHKQGLLLDRTEYSIWSHFCTKTRQWYSNVVTWKALLFQNMYRVIYMRNNCLHNITMTSQRAQWLLKSSVIRAVVSPFVSTNFKTNIKASFTGPLKVLKF